MFFKPTGISCQCQHTTGYEISRTSSSGFVGKKLEVWHKVQYNHIKAESIERIKKPLRRRARKKSEESYETVYYKRRATNGWRVQAKVPWKEGNFVLISYDAASYQRITSYKRAHNWRAMLLIILYISVINVCKFPWWRVYYI